MQQTSEHVAATDLAPDHDQPTGDANPDHGYESDGDVKMVDEQDTAKEIKAQTDFQNSHPEVEALASRHRDAASHLNERMSYNHRLDKDSIASPDSEQATHAPQTDTSDPTWQDGLRRDENDNV